MCERRSRVSGSMVWYSSSIPMVKLGFIGLPRRARTSGAGVQEIGPPHLRHDQRALLRLLDRQVGHRIHDPLEVFRSYGVEVGIRGRIQKIDGIRNTVLNGELNGVQIVAKGFAQR